MIEHISLQVAGEPSSAETAAFNYIISLLPQLITIVAAIAAGFKFLQRDNEKKIDQMKNSILAKFDVERDFVGKDIKSIQEGISNLDNQYRIVTGYIKEQVERHDRLLDRIGGGSRT